MIVKKVCYQTFVEPASDAIAIETMLIKSAMHNLKV